MSLKLERVLLLNWPLVHKQITHSDRPGGIFSLGSPVPSAQLFHLSLCENRERERHSSSAASVYPPNPKAISGHKSWIKSSAGRLIFQFNSREGILIIFDNISILILKHVHFMSCKRKSSSINLARKVLSFGYNVLNGSEIAWEASFKSIFSQPISAKGKQIGVWCIKSICALGTYSGATLYTELQRLI